MTFDDSFETPSRLPQFSTEEEFRSLHEEMDSAPLWAEGMAAELAHLCKTHQVVRSAIMYAMQLARHSELMLRTVGTIEEVKFHQGVVKGLETYVKSLMEQMIEADTATKEEEEDVDS